MNLSWLPWRTQRLHAAVRNKATWGYVIYRTTYTPESDTAFPQIINLLNTYIKQELYSEYASTPKSQLHNAEPTPYHEIWAQHLPVIMTDQTQFNEASIDSIRAHFESWVNTQEKQNHTTCIVIDEESLQAFLDAQTPNEKSEPNMLGIHSMRYIKVITAFPEVDEYDSFMGAEYNGEWLGRTNMNSSPSGKGMASSESDDDEYDSFLGG
ncbi:uncharacterized protein PGRI_013390 [Penicillium griseofulvum]|uniref:Uncharacterized protein n=1 Tax=Penicillium patulum TaxID=5078 RepID=A0A135LEU3_PENPA|nr:uncharacterized protein PGRI_013390 [Penicillium griseofulvum]KXG47469.1 hypothetical protein PGRI_013390 [Penicillium griseofulvum]